MLRILKVLPLLLLMACGGSKTDSDNFSSPKNLFIDYVSSYTGNVISSQSDIRVKLTGAIGDSLIGTEIPGFFSFSPKIEGQAVWEARNTIVFKPTTSLPNGQTYEVTADLSKAIPDIDKDKREFRFMFQTLVQNYEASVFGLVLYDVKDLTRVKVEGQIQTADYVTYEAIQQMIAASQGGVNKNISWENTGQNNTFKFTIEDITKSKKESQVALKFLGQAIGVERNENLNVEVPSLDNYKVVSSKVVDGVEKYISVLFSDPLDARQNLQGLISLAGASGSPRLVINLNELKIYPKGNIGQQLTLTINESVKNTGGYGLTEDFRATLVFAQVKPEVRLVDKGSKSILPNNENLTLAFEAIGLNSVEVSVIRVYEDNILQYFQVNELNGDYQLNRVAKPILRKIIPLNTTGVTNLNTWNRFDLDLDQIINTQPGEIYQVRIGFKKHHSLYFCSTAEGEASTEGTIDNADEVPGWDYYDSYYGRNYYWRDRDDPCSESYFGNYRSVQKILFASNVGIIAKRREEGKLYVFANDLITTEGLSGAVIRVYNYQQQEIATSQTDDQGQAILTTEEVPYLLVAEKDNQTGYLRLDDGSALSLSNFDVSGSRIQNGLKGFMYGERGVWRPSDTIHLSFILEDVAATLPEDHPVILELSNPNGQIVQRKVSSQSISGIYRFDFVTDKDAPTGNWLAKAKVGGATFVKTVKVETIKPNRLKVDLTFDKEVFTASDNNPSADLNVRWLTGATARNLKAVYELKLVPIKTKFKDFPNFNFDDQSKTFYSQRELAYEGKVDQNGFARMNFDLGANDEAPGALRANFYGKVYEEGGDFSVNSASIPYFPYNTFVGIKAPEGDRRNFLSRQTKHNIEIATVDAQGNPVDRSGLEVTMYKVGWRWWWDRSSDNISNYLRRSNRIALTKTRLDTKNGRGQWVLDPEELDWGRHYMVVRDPRSGHSAGQVIYMSWYGNRGEGLEGASMLDFEVDKETYEVGEDISISIPTTEGTRTLVSLETGSEVVQTFWVEGENGNTNFSFEATTEMAPNVYAHLTMVQPHGQTTNDLPIRLYGVQSIKVVDPTTVLEPVVTMPTELRPEQEFTLKVSEASGKSMGYTVAIVDEGLLDITNFNTPDPWNKFYAREALGIKTWDLYDQVIGASTGEIQHLLAVGGDGELKAQDQTEANRFKPVVKMLGPFQLESGGSNEHKIQLPQYIGSVKTMIVAAENRAYGKTEVATPVRQPLMVLATLPRVAGPAETMKLPVNVFALAENIRDVQVSVTTKGTLALDGVASQQIKFQQAGDQIIYFDIKAKEAIGPGYVTVTAKSADVEATYDIELQVQPRNSEVTLVDDKTMNASDVWSYAYKPVGLLGNNKMAIEVSTLPPLNLESRLNYLIRYPHGCVEQTTSSVFAQLFLSDLTELSEERKQRVQRNIQAAIKRLNSFQTSSGGFSYWPGDNYDSDWGSNYAGHFLLEARIRGYAVPDAMINDWIKFQTKRADSWDNNSSNYNNDLTQAYRLYGLALAEQPALGAMNRLRSNGSLKQAAKWRLALAYVQAGYDNQAKSLVKGLSAQVDDDRGYYSYTYGSAVRDQSMIMETLMRIGEGRTAFEILRSIAEKLGENNRWMSTQTTAYALIAISKYAQEYGSDNVTEATVEVTGKVTRLSGKSFIHQVSVPDPEKATNIKIRNSGEAPVFARIIRTGTPLEGNEQAETRNLNLLISYFDMDGRTLDVSSLKQGTNFKAQVTVTNPGRKGLYEELALTQIFPSGWEIINTRLDGSAENNSLVEYLDIRDDRAMHYFDLQPNKRGTFTVLLNATYQGRYYLPGITAEAMYDNSVFASTEGKWVNVIGED